MPGMINDIRRVLRDAGFFEARGDSRWGFQATPGTTPGVVHLRYVRDPDARKREGSVRFGNEQVSKYVRTLQNEGFRTSRVRGVKEVDTLLVMRS